MLITDAVMELYDRIVDKNLLIRRINITANRLVDENSAKKEDKMTATIATLIAAFTP